MARITMQHIVETIEFGKVGIYSVQVQATSNDLFTVLPAQANSTAGVAAISGGALGTATITTDAAGNRSVIDLDGFAVGDTVLVMVYQGKFGAGLNYSPIG